MASKKVLMVLTSVDKFPDGSATGWYLPEAAHPYYKFIEAGYSVVFCSISGTAVVDPSSISATKEDAECVKFMADESLVKATSSHAKLSEVDASGFDVVFFVGGFGTMWDFPESAAVQETIKQAWAQGKVVAAVCHGPCALFNVTLDDGTYLVAGKDVTAFTNGEENAMSKYDVVSTPSGPGSCEDVLSQRGATFHDGGVFQPKVCVSGNLFTGQNPPSAGPLAAAIVAAL